MLAGKYDGEEVSLSKLFEAVGAYKAGLIDESKLHECETGACPGCGSCAGMYTANSMNCLCEAGRHRASRQRHHSGGQQ